MNDERKITEAQDETTDTEMVFEAVREARRRHAERVEEDDRERTRYMTNAALDFEAVREVHRAMARDARKVKSVVCDLISALETTADGGPHFVRLGRAGRMAFTAIGLLTKIAEGYAECRADQGRIEGNDRTERVLKRMEERTEEDAS